jgi:hypothetical protein
MQYYPETDEWFLAITGSYNPLGSTLFIFSSPIMFPDGNSVWVAEVISESDCPFPDGDEEPFERGKIIVFCA